MLLIVKIKKKTQNVIFYIKKIKKINVNQKSNRDTIAFYLKI